MSHILTRSKTITLSCGEVFIIAEVGWWVSKVQDPDWLTVVEECLGETDIYLQWLAH